MGELRRPCRVGVLHQTSAIVSNISLACTYVGATRKRNQHSCNNRPEASVLSHPVVIHDGGPQVQSHRRILGYSLMKEKKISLKVGLANSSEYRVSRTMLAYKLRRHLITEIKSLGCAIISSRRGGNDVPSSPHGANSNYK